MRERHNAIIQEAYDMAKLTIREGFRNYQSLKEEKQALARAIFLGKIQSGIGIIARLAPDLQALGLQERLEEVTKKWDEIEENIQMQGRVKPLVETKPIQHT